MRLSIDLPATLDELDRFLAVARDLGVSHVAPFDTGYCSALAADTDAEPIDLVPAAIDPIPPVLADLAAAEKAAPAKATKVAKRAGTKVPAKATCKAGGYLAAALNLIADQGGTWDGSGTSLGRAVHPANPSSGAQTVKNALHKGYVTFTRDGRKVTAVALTKAGYEAIDRVPTVGNIGELSPLTDPEPSATVVPMPDAGPIERRKFDPDAARMGAAAAL